MLGLETLSLSSHEHHQRYLSDFNKKTREFLGISDGLVRISMGLENPQNIKNFTQASR